MKNSRGGFVIPVIIAVIALLAIGGGVYYVKNIKNPADNFFPGHYNDVLGVGPSRTTYSDKQNEFSFRYLDEKYVQMQSKNAISIKNTTIDYNEIKLIPKDREQKIGKKECMYGESGITSVCNIRQEFGIGFGVINLPIWNIVNGLEKSLIEYVHINSNLEQVVKYSIGAEGSGVEYYFIQLDKDKTLAVTRSYDNNSSPTKEDFESITNTISLRYVSRYFTAQPLYGATPQLVTFTIDGDATSFTKIDFGDGTSSSRNDFTCTDAGRDTVCHGTHTYLRDGEYRADLYVGNGTKLHSVFITVIKQ